MIPNEMLCLGSVEFIANIRSKKNINCSFAFQLKSHFLLSCAEKKLSGLLHSYQSDYTF